jgi:hypothetical protein
MEHMPEIDIKKLNLFTTLGKIIQSIGNSKDWPGYEIGINEQEYNQLDNVVKKQFSLNGWFTEKNVRLTFLNWSKLLIKSELEKWLNTYKFSNKPKKIGIIMAGNIPLVGFHDFLSVIFSGNIAVIKLSSDDKTLLPALIDILKIIDESILNQVEICDYKLGNVDAIIATGSNNSMTYFTSYFGHLPHLFRKNRTSIAILDGNETKEELAELGKDIFTYFGLGCRNVSQLLIPEDFNLDRFFEAIVDYSEVVNHHKYANNYDYNKAIHLMNLEQFLDNGFVLLKESDALFSPLAMCFYHRYSNLDEIVAFKNKYKNDIQAIVSRKNIPFGKAQAPSLTDYADGVDTMKWLETI